MVHVATAQYDLGVSFGIYELYFRNIALIPEGRQWSAAMFYRERVASHTDLGVELLLVDRRLGGTWSTGEPRIYHDVQELWMQHLYVAPTVDVRMGRKGNNVVRFGPQFGLKLFESYTGEINTGPPGSLNRSMVDDLVSARTDHFRNEFRFLIGFGFRIPFGPRMAMVLDPYYSGGISSLLRDEPRVRVNEYGLRLGLAARRYDRSLTQRIKEKRAPAEKE